MNSNKKLSMKIAITYLLFVALLTLFRSGVSGILSLYYVEKGMENHAISSIKSFQNIGILVGLLPAGFLADRIGRLKVLMFSSWVMATSFVVMLISNSQLNFSLAEMLYGIGLALNSGILIAYISDLQLEKNVFLSNQTIGRRTTVLNISTLIGGNIGTFLFARNYNLPLYFSITGLFLYPIIILGWTHLMEFKDNSSINSLKKTNFYKKDKFSINKLLLHVSIINLIFEIGIQFIMVYWSIYFVQKLNFNLSIIYTLMLLSVIFGNEIYVLGSKKRSNHMLVVISAFLMTISTILIGILENKIGSLIFFILFELCTGIFTNAVHVLQNQALLNQEKKSKTLSSIDFFTEIIIIISLQFINVSIEFLGVKIMFVISGCLFATIIVKEKLNLKGRKIKNGI
ncbi:MFS transporter [Pseudolactococcus reticulitermitis]|uniref:Major facilitator superfamily (MFS) profile domain-containing protein n=1 Tax=Pseudolactococcus reticulitermitis TaxID=2025039 RepID=A0A224X231_9LACT|nr:MFS transporter [Lactococcus reticulitermitis]GAX48217.1 hypothetical protein RsY01_1832 [Lactococcus reticulitermitis]